MKRPDSRMNYSKINNWMNRCLAPASLEATGPSPATPVLLHGKRLSVNLPATSTLSRAALRCRTMIYVTFLLLFALDCLPALGQYTSIVEHTASGLACGGPGRRGCPLLPTCTSPSGNELRDDKFTSLVLCDLPGSAELDGDGSESTPIILQQYMRAEPLPFLLQSKSSLENPIRLQPSCTTLLWSTLKVAALISLPAQ